MSYVLRQDNSRYAECIQVKCSSKLNLQSLQKLLRLTIFLWKSPKNMLDLLKDIQNFLFPRFNVVCAKSVKAMPGSGGQEWPRKLVTNID